MPARLLATAALLLTACWYPKERGQRLEERVDRIETSPVKPAEPAPLSPAAEAKLKGIDARVGQLQAKVDDLGGRAAKGGPEVSAKLDQVAQEVSELKASMGGYAERLDGMEKAIADLRARSARQAAAERQPAPAERRAAPAERQAAPPATPAPRAEAQGASGIGGVLALAREQERKGDKAVARDLYSEYVAKYPDGAGAAQAHFRLGEMAFADRRYQDAIHEYGLVARDFPGSSLAPDALLRTADAMAQLNLKEDAATVLAGIPRRYPGTPAAQRAKERLAEVNGK